MQLVINTYGSYIQKEGDCFKVRTDEKVFEISCKKVSSILISTAAYITTDAIKMAMENNIDIVFVDEHGNPYARVWHSKLGSTVLIRRKQLEISTTTEDREQRTEDTNKGFELAKEWIVKKIENQIDFLERLKRTRESLEIFGDPIKSLMEIKGRIKVLGGTIDEKRGTIMALEGAAGKIYFNILSYIMPDRFKFDGRSRNPAKDEFNAMLNYAYGVLYSLVEKACIIAGLDPYIGFLHTDNYNKKSLVFDLIEMFRIFAEETVVYLFTGKKVKVEYFDEVKGGFTLNKEGKAILIEALNKTLDETMRYKGRNIQKRNIIQFECHSIANGLIRGQTIRQQT